MKLLKTQKTKTNHLAYQKRVDSELAALYVPLVPLKASFGLWTIIAIIILKINPDALLNAA